MSDLMNFGNYVQFLFALLLVLGLIGLFALALRRLSQYGVAGLRKGEGKRRLRIEETMMLDGKRRLVLVRRDDREHLLLLGADRDLVVETGIDGVAASDTDTGASSPAAEPEKQNAAARVANLGAEARRLLTGERRGRR